MVGQNHNTQSGVCYYNTVGQERVNGCFVGFFLYTD